MTYLSYFSTSHRILYVRGTDVTVDDFVGFYDFFIYVYYRP